MHRSEMKSGTKESIAFIFLNLDQNLVIFSQKRLGVQESWRLGVLP